ncbi:hypothetical protein HDU92_008686, partial [Lobulomyces angularis]
MVFIDEAHLLISWNSFRSDIVTLISNLRCIHTPIVFVTATLPYYMQKAITNKFYLSEVETFRSRSVILRKVVDNVHVFCEEVESYNYAKKKFLRISRLSTRFPCNLLINVNSTKDVDNLFGYLQRSNALNAKIYNYYFKMQIFDLSLNVNDNDKIRIMISTTALCYGIDYPNITTVIKIGVPNDFTGYVQLKGRLEVLLDFLSMLSWIDLFATGKTCLRLAEVFFLNFYGRKNVDVEELIHCKARKVRKLLNVKKPMLSIAPFLWHNIYKSDHQQFLASSTKNAFKDTALHALTKNNPIMES